MQSAGSDPGDGQSFFADTRAVRARLRRPIPSRVQQEHLASSRSFAWITSIGNLGGFLDPSIVGWIRDSTGSFSAGLYSLAAFALMSAVISALWLDIRRRAATSGVIRTAVQ